MSAAGRNIMKLIVGSALGSAVAMAVTKLAEREDVPEEQRMSFADTAKSTPIRLRDRWERAKEAGTIAEAETEAHLTEVFRSKVNDADALKPPFPPSR